MRPKATNAEERTCNKMVGQRVAGHLILDELPVPISLAQSETQSFALTSEYWQPTYMKSVSLSMAFSIARKLFFSFLNLRKIHSTIYKHLRNLSTSSTYKITATTLIMTTWMDWVSVVSSIFGILGFTGVALGIWAFCIDRKKRAAEADVGRVCCDKDEMGYFSIKEPSVWCFWKFSKKVKRPIVPSISTIINWGDNLVFTSALFDSIPPNDNEVCWLPIYEGVFNEIAWTPNASFPKKNCFFSLGVDRPHLLFCVLQWLSAQPKDVSVEALDRYTKKAEKHIKILRDHSETVIKARERKVNPKAYDINDLDLENQIYQNAYLDRHVLYERSFRNGPHLINCVRPLKDESRQPTLVKIKSVRIYKHKPCIDTSAIELFTLSLILGMRFPSYGDPTLISGHGAFGTSLTSRWKQAIAEFYLAYSNELGDIVEKPMGSGYSTLFAKYLACGGIPLGIDHFDRTITIVITRPIRDAIHLGKVLDFDFDTTLTNRAIETLFRIPGLRYDQVLCDAKLWEGTKGRITLWGGKEKLNYYWWRVVAGIAFGGLVPQSTWNLVETVQFTALGGLQLGEEYLSELQNLIEKVREKVDKEDYFHLFGRYRVRGNMLKDRDKEGISYSYERALYFSKNLSTRTAARVFSIYMTLLECVAAQRQSHIDKTGNPASIKSVVDDIFEACCEELERAYHKAIKDPGHTDSAKEPTEKQAEEPSEEYIRDMDKVQLEQSHFLDPDDRETASGILQKAPLNSEIEISDQIGQGSVPDIESMQREGHAQRIWSREVSWTLPKTDSSSGGPKPKESCGHNHDDERPEDLASDIKLLADSMFRDDDKVPFCRYRCGKIARFIIAAWAHQVKIVRWGDESDDELKEGREMDPIYRIPEPEIFPHISALGGF